MVASTYTYIYMGIMFYSVWLLLYVFLVRELIIAYVLVAATYIYAGVCVIANYLYSRYGI